MSNTDSPVFFTICSKNLLGYAKTCLESVRKFHPESHLYIFLADRFLGPKNGLDENGITVVTLEEHGGIAYRDMMFRYNITEFNTSIKPFCFVHLFEKYERGTGVVYLDPDTWLVSPLEEVCEGFDNGADAVLIPHMTEPMGYGNLPDRTLLRYGAYNFGFVGIKNTDHNVEVMCWWADELKDNCVIDYANGLFVDQKYGDLFPSFIPNTLILRHQGYNVAYWNLFSRVISKDDHGNYRSNSDPLRFLHFSGASLTNDSPKISRHCTTLYKKHRSLYGKLLDSWSERLEANLHSVHLKEGYSFFWNNETKENEHTPETKDHNGQIVPFVKNQWMYMLQFTSMAVHELWEKNEQLAIQIVGSTLEEPGSSSAFCNSCFEWSSLAAWDNDCCAKCGANSHSRLVSAFVYQELKLEKNDRIYVTHNDDDQAIDLPSEYASNTEESNIESDSIQSCDHTTTQLAILASKIEPLKELFKTSILSRVEQNTLVALTDFSDVLQRQNLDDLLCYINSHGGYRASLFTGLSANHAIDGKQTALMYIESFFVGKNGLDILDDFGASRAETNSTPLPSTRSFTKVA